MRPATTAMKTSALKLTLAFALAPAAFGAEDFFGVPKPAIVTPAVPPLAPRPASRPENTSELGSNWGDRYRNVPGDGSLLTGFLIHGGTREGNPTVGGLQPVFLGPKGRVVGSTYGTATNKPIAVEAKPGYAVGGIAAKAGAVVDGFEVFFMRILPGASALDPGDFYRSDWFGGTGGGNKRYVGSDGRPVVGISGHSGKDFNAIGLVQNAPSTIASARFTYLAKDDASNYPRDWENGGNKGTGFGPWVFACTDKSRSDAGFGIGTSTSNGVDRPSGGIDAAGRSWMMRTIEKHEASATRAFAGGPLKPGQQFCVRMDNGHVAPKEFAGFILQNAAGADRLEFSFEGFNDPYRVKVSGTEDSAGVEWLADGLHIVFTQFAGNRGLLDIRAAGGRFVTIPVTLTASDISQVKLYTRGPGTGPESEVFWNSLAIRQPVAAGP